MPNYLTYPKVKKGKNNQYFVEFYLNHKRFRLSSGNKIGLPIYPNTHKKNERKQVAKKLASYCYEYLTNNNYSFKKRIDILSLFNKLIENKLNEPLSKKYKKHLKSISNKMKSEIKSKGALSPFFIDTLSLKYENCTSYNTSRRHVNVIVNYLYENGFPIKRSRLKSKKQIEKLHKPIRNLKEIFLLIGSYNRNLYLCTLLTYGCLLRPHSEIRLLKWGDFSDDLSKIKLSGERVKSKRNRIVPVPKYIRIELKRGDDNINIFTNTPKPYNNDYFKGVWRRFKNTIPSVEQGVTLYSFRHTGAIEVYKRTVSLSKLQKAMGHSSLKVSLTYLRGLEVEDLKEEDMPMI